MASWCILNIKMTIAKALEVIVKAKYSAKLAFSQLQSRFGVDLKPVPSTIKFTKDVEKFVKKMNEANQVAFKGTLVFK